MLGREKHAGNGVAGNWDCVMGHSTVNSINNKIIMKSKKLAPDRLVLSVQRATETPA